MLVCVKITAEAREGYSEVILYVTIKMMAVHRRGQSAGAGSTAPEKWHLRKIEEIIALVQMGYEEKFSA